MAAVCIAVTVISVHDIVISVHDISAQYPQYNLTYTSSVSVSVASHHMNVLKGEDVC